MKFVCEHCFSDKELQGFILAQGELGVCDCCKSTDVKVIELKELQDFFEVLLSNFREEKNGEFLIHLIQGNWSLFSKPKYANKILEEMLLHIKSPFKTAEVKVDFSTEILDNINYWDILKEQLKWKTRYFTDINELIDLGWDGFFESKIAIHKEDVFYRARLHHESNKPTYKKSEMFSPPPHYISSGRANPIGIPYLYLSDNKETVLYEIRATYLDEISIGEFGLNDEYKQKIIISDFTENPTLFHPKQEEIDKRIKSTLLKKRISKDLSKPLRRYDSPIDYIPTQFICEFIKNFTNVSGIKFQSSLHKSGNNLVVFDDSVMTCYKVEKHKVSEVKIQSVRE